MTRLHEAINHFRALDEYKERATVFPKRTKPGEPRIAHKTGTQAVRLRHGPPNRAAHIAAHKHKVQFNATQDKAHPAQRERMKMMK
jgi:hypothetical protein